mgnify:CR=1 FL=1
MNKEKLTQALKSVIDDLGDQARKPSEYPNAKREYEAVRHVIKNIERLQVSFKDAYRLVLWPESQAYMDEPWFDDHAILADVEAIGESQAYFIPIEYT